jgi:hypothetical protein
VNRKGGEDIGEEGKRGVLEEARVARVGGEYLKYQANKRETNNQ